jgi:hypothetical protein
MSVDVFLGIRGFPGGTRSLYAEIPLDNIELRAEAGPSTPQDRSRANDPCCAQDDSSIYDDNLIGTTTLSRLGRR